MLSNLFTKIRQHLFVKKNNISKPYRICLELDDSSNLEWFDDIQFVGKPVLGVEYAVFAPQLGDVVFGRLIAVSKTFKKREF